MEVSKKLQLESRWIIVPILICIIIGSAGTLMGSNFSIMLSGYMEFDFMEFLFYDGRCGLFFISFVLFLVVLFMINLLFKDDKYYVGEDNNVVVKDYFPLILLFSTILILIISSVFKSLYVSGLLGMMLFVFSSIYYKNYKLFIDQLLKFKKLKWISKLVKKLESLPDHSLNLLVILQKFILIKLSLEQWFQSLDVKLLLNWNTNKFKNYKGKYYLAF